jgi:hypothetical protein
MSRAITTTVLCSRHRKVTASKPQPKIPFRHPHTSFANLTPITPKSTPTRAGRLILQTEETVRERKYRRALLAIAELVKAIVEEEMSEEEFQQSTSQQQFTDELLATDLQRVEQSLTH